MVQDKDNSIIWPAVLKCSGDDELIYIASEEKWHKEEELHLASYNETDVLIDSSGAVFSLLSKQGKHIKPEFRDERMSLEDVLELVKAHAAQQASCCVAKLFAPTIHEAFTIVELFGE